MNSRYDKSRDGAKAAHGHSKTYAQRNDLRRKSCLKHYILTNI